MRHFRDFPEALNEVRRELKEMGIVVKSKSVQNLDISLNDDYSSYELQDYSYRVLHPDFTSIPLKVPEWAEAEFKERTSGEYLNPGEAWKLRKDYWEQFLNSRGEFDYAYPQRMADTLPRVINALKQDPSTRRAFLTIIRDDEADNFGVRFPCSIGYHLLYRQNQLNLTYYLRSSDFSTHFNYDIFLATKLQHYIAEQTGLKPGFFTHVIGSLHIFSKDVKSVF